jgi:hypothetical protein
MKIQALCSQLALIENWNPICNNLPQWGRENDLQSNLLDPLISFGRAGTERNGAEVDAWNAGVGNV